jgi:hypothetical protein
MTHSLHTPGKWLGVLCCVLLITGCTTKTQIYHWGSYENQLYARFSTNTNPEQQIDEMEKTLHTNKVNRPMPPGFHAHLGLLYGEMGNIDKMREHFTIEKNLFPESAAFMDFLLNKSTPAKGKQP